MTDLSTLFRQRIAESSRVIASLESQLGELLALSQSISATLAGGRQLLTAGNGGSAAEALHLAEEITGKYKSSRRRALPAICLNADPTALTCIANDWDFSQIFARQIEAYARPGDLLVFFSSSGNSANLLEACHRMHQAGGKTLGLLGKGGGKALALCDQALVVQSQETAFIQEAHQVILHLIMEQLERDFTPAV